jgi:hypothetical protein
MTSGVSSVLSSTNTTSAEIPFSAWWIRINSGSMFPDSFRVGITIDNSYSVCVSDVIGVKSLSILFSTI